MFALVIGINEYHSHSVPNLQGAVPDAEAMVGYLRDYLRVPNDHITTLYNHEATRNGIIKALKDLASDSRIAEKDPILIYYAGHGTELDAPVGWPTGGQKIQSLVPVDEGNMTSDGEKVTSIPDRTLGSLLDKLAGAKGDNITVILDCCHSASGTRALTSDVRVRHVEAAKLTALRPNTDKEIVSGIRALVVPKRQRRTGSQSHVLLAACGAKESAKEPEGRGAFTKALLEVLYEARPDGITYTEVMERLPTLPDQTPQCEGKHKARVLFNAKVAGADRQFVRVLKVGDAHLLQAGAAQGVGVGARFDVHADRVLNASFNPPLASFMVKSVGPLQSELEPVGAMPDPLPSQMYGRQTMEGETSQLKVFFTEGFVECMYHDIAGWKEGLSGSRGVAEFGYAKTESEAGLVIGLDRGYAVYKIRHSEVNASELVRTPRRTGVTAKEVMPVIRAAAKWKWHASRTNPEDPFEGKVRIEMVRLEQQNGEPLAPVGDNMNASGTVEVMADDDQAYGFRLVNESQHDLYPYLFCFDANDLSIDHYYFSPSGGRAGFDAQLPGKGPNGNRIPGELTIGYGPSGSPGCVPTLMSGEDQDICILKLFVTTSSAEFDSLVQQSPFTPPKRAMHRASVCEDRGKQELWGTTSVKILIRRPVSRYNLVYQDISRSIRGSFLPFPEPKLMSNTLSLGESDRQRYQKPPSGLYPKFYQMPTPCVEAVCCYQPPHNYSQTDMDCLSMGLRMSVLASCAAAPQLVETVTSSFVGVNGEHRMPIPYTYAS
ncbi:ICE-like protease (caspase) p20 domain protein [Ceratobasidium sp. AG-Ba]|nr:ICE-like protease (caspase) p20 domain protein [Ceratobasidium sp. AG-Ba]